MPNLYWRALSGPEGQTAGLVNNQGTAPLGSRASIIDPSDVVYPAPGGGLLRVPVGGGAPVPVNGTDDGQLMYYDAAAGLWLPTATAPSDGDIALWDAGANQWVFSPAPNLGALQYFDNRASPVGLWNFNGTLADANGVTDNDYTLAAGSIGFCDVVPGKLGLYLYAGSRYETVARPPALALTGDMSFFAIVQQDSIPLVEQPIARFGGNLETEATNVLWSCTFTDQTSPTTAPRRLTYLSEHGAGINDAFISGGDASLPPVHNIVFLGFTRIANVIQPYVNGLPFGPPSSAINTPTGGTDATCRSILGSNITTTTVSHPFVLFTQQVIDLGLSADGVRAIYNQSMGPAFGVI